MKLDSGRTVSVSAGAFSALGRAVWDETLPPIVLEVSLSEAFSALGRAVWDETPVTSSHAPSFHRLSVLSVEPYGMKQICRRYRSCVLRSLSVLSVEPYGMKHSWFSTNLYNIARLSVLSVEPYGMKHNPVFRK